MAHELSIQNGKAEMFYVGEEPWHHLGTKLNNPATSAEAMQAAHLNWTVDESPVYRRGDGDEAKAEIEGWKVLERSDNREVLTVARKSFTPVQNAQAFAFLDAVVGEGRLRYHTAGALFGGRRIWLLAKLPGELVVKGTDDVTEKFLLLANGHDGGLKLHVRFTPIRVVCNNTLTIAMRDGAEQGVALRHTVNISDHVQEAQTALGMAVRYFDDLQGYIDRLAAKIATDSEVSAFARELIADPLGEVGKRNAQVKRDRLIGMARHGIGNDQSEIRGSWWAAFNGAVEYVDHARMDADASEKMRNNRLNSIWFGWGAELKARAFDLAVQGASN